MKKDLNYYAQRSLYNRSQKNLECDLTLTVDGIKYHAYEVSVAHQDLLFFTDKGTLNYVVDNYGGTPRVELFNIETDEE